jgi:hypothetical protein
MALHPRLQLPTLEQPPRRSHGFTLALALTVLAAGFAYAMPRAMNVNAEEPTDGVVLTPTGSTHTLTASPSPTPTESDDDDGDEGRPENHGAAVSTAAHCDLDGKAHGAFVRSIAHDKDATVAEVEAACEAAQAAAATAADSDDGATHGRGHGKPDKVKSDDDDTDESEDDEAADTDDGDDAGEDDSDHGGPPDHAKGDKDKP